MDCCRKTTGMLFKPKTADQMEKWKEQIGYTGTATADFQICTSLFPNLELILNTKCLVSLLERKDFCYQRPENLYLRGPTSKQLDGLKITEGLEGERMIEEEKFKNRKKVF